MDWTLYFEKQAQKGFEQPIHYEDHFKHQIGGSFYVGARKQLGYGLGGLLAKIGRMVIPILKPVAKSLGRQVLKSGARFAGDVINGQNAKQAFKQNLQQGAKELFMNTTQRGRVRKKVVKRGRGRKNNAISNLKRPRQQDIFD